MLYEDRNLLRRVFIAMIINMFMFNMIIWHDPNFSAMEKKPARMFTKITEITDPCY